MELFTIEIYVFNKKNHKYNSIIYYLKITFIGLLLVHFLKLILFITAN